MKNGFHDHFCQTCNTGFVCHKVTHCNDDFKTECLNCRQPKGATNEPLEKSGPGLSGSQGGRTVHRL